LVYLNPDHQNLIDRIMGLHEKGWIPKKISEHLNALG
jgi:broad-specificity NMP kinase